MEFYGKGKGYRLLCRSSGGNLPHDRGFRTIQFSRLNSNKTQELVESCWDAIQGNLISYETERAFTVYHRLLVHWHCGYVIGLYPCTVIFCLSRPHPL